VPALLAASHLTRRFGARVAVDDVSLEVQAGEIVCLLGPNGAGKTTTLRMLAGLLAPSAGDVRIGGEPFTADTSSRLRGRIGLLTEAPGLWDRLTVTENLRVHARLQGLANPERAVDEALARFDLSSRRDDLTAQLSKGLKQRVALARALLHDPAVVLLDEPTSGLDPAGAHLVRDLMHGLRREGRALLISTHNLDEAERTADRIAILHTRLLALDTPSALRARLTGARVRVTCLDVSPGCLGALQAAGFTDVRHDGPTLSIGVDDPGTRTPTIVRTLVQAGAELTAVAPEVSTLEEVYLAVASDGPHPHGSPA